MAAVDISSVLPYILVPPICLHRYRFHRNLVSPSDQSDLRGTASLQSTLPGEPITPCWPFLRTLPWVYLSEDVRYHCYTILRFVRSTDCCRLSYTVMHIRFPCVSTSVRQLSGLDVFLLLPWRLPTSLFLYRFYPPLPRLLLFPDGLQRASALQLRRRHLDTTW